MNHLTLSVGATSLQVKLEELGRDFDADVLSWASQGKAISDDALSA